MNFASIAAALTLLGTLALALPAHGQQADHVGAHAGHDNAYAALGDRDIKALSNEELAALLAGEGMGFALAAELNGVHGPLHVLELSEALELDPPAIEAITRVFDDMRSRTAQLGSAAVELERTLDRRFAHRHIDPALIRELTGEIAALRGEIRAIHLEAHLEVDALLTEEQRVRYLQLRGYAADDTAASAEDHGPPHP
jgi:Spy/CpxP family protein refolding chaperone